MAQQRDEDRRGLGIEDSCLGMAKSASRAIASRQSGGRDATSDKWGR